MVISRLVWGFVCLAAGIMTCCIPGTVVGAEWEHYTTADGLISNDVTALFEANDGSIWIGPWVGAWGAPGVNQYVNGEILTWDSGAWAPSDVKGFCHDRMGRIWACSYNRGPVFLEHGLWKEGFYWGADEPAFSNAGVKCDSEGRLWAGFLSGIMRHDPATNQSTKVWSAPPYGSGMDSSPIRFLFIDADDNIWFTCSDSPAPLIRIDRLGNELSSYTGMWGEVCQAADGTIWLGRGAHTNDGAWFGVGRLEGSQFVSVSPPSGSFPAEPAGPICISSRGEIITGSYGWNSCGVFIYDGVNWQYFETPFLSSDMPCPIHDVIVDRNGDIWIAVTAREPGLWVLHRDQSSSDIAVGLSTNQAEYTAGNPMSLSLDIASSQAMTVDLYVALELPSGGIIFYPSLDISWSALWPGLLLPAGTNAQDYELFNLTLPDLPAGTYRWFAACTHAGTMEFASNIASCEWEFVK